MRRAVLRARRIVVGHIFPELMPELAAFDGTGIVRFAARAFCRLRAVLRARRIAVGDVCHKFMPEFVDGLLLDVVARRAFALPFAVLRAGCGLRYLPFSVIVRRGNAKSAAARSNRKKQIHFRLYRGRMVEIQAWQDCRGHAEGLRKPDTQIYPQNIYG